MKRNNNRGAGNPTRIEILDGTLRERIFGVSFALGEKLAIAHELDLMGVSFIESATSTTGSSGEYFGELSRAMGRGASEPVLFAEGELDEAIPESVENVTLRRNCFASPKVTASASYSPEENIEATREIVSSLKELGKNVFFDAAHFFDAFAQDTPYALSVLESAVEGGASRLVLCDSRGAAIPSEVEKATRLVASHFSSRQDVLVGIHAHNDCGLALANSIAALDAGARHIQGTINGVGERAGNTDLCQLLPLLVFRLGYEALNNLKPKEEQLLGLKSLSEKVASACGFSYAHRPFVSERAFAHTDPLHVSEVEKNPSTYEVLNPSLVGNSRKTGVDDASQVLSEMWKLGLYAKDRGVVASKVLARMRELEAFGYKFDDAKASVHLLILETIGSDIRPFEVVRWEISTLRTMNGTPEVSGTLEVKIGEGEKEKKVSTTAKGVGPIHAIDLALRKALDSEFPELKNLRLVSYSLNIVDSLNGTAAAARARTEFIDGETAHILQSASDRREQSWATISVSDDVLDASIRALVDGYRYKLIFRNKRERYAIPDWKVALSERYSERW